ncbi:MAG: hypothetical protein ACK5B9_11520 [Flavobacteriia bacterium]|jgi:hypothetical protein
MKIIGIDVGKSGGIAIINEDGSLTLHTIPLIGKEVDLLTMFKILQENTKEKHIVAIEDVTSLQGVSAKANFSFGENKGHYEGLLVGMKATYQKVAPKTWQKVCWEGVPIQKKSTGKNDTKATSLLSARRLFPNESFLATVRSSVPHDGLIDAALIAKYLEIKYRS